MEQLNPEQIKWMNQCLLRDAALGSMLGIIVGGAIVAGFLWLTS